VNTPLEILGGVTADNCEARYHAFYPACKSGSFAAGGGVTKWNFLLIIV